jgi:hypothetical protein
MAIWFGVLKKSKIANGSKKSLQADRKASCLIRTNKLTYASSPVLACSFYEIGRARRGVSGTLYSQSAIARLNSFPRVNSAEPLLP